MFLQPPPSGPLPAFCFGNAVIDPNTGKSMEYRALISTATTAEAWQHFATNEFGRLAQGLKRGIIGTDTIEFTPRTDAPHDRNVLTYARFVCTIRPQNQNKNTLGSPSEAT
jgi:hypothetical protein